MSDFLEALKSDGNYIAALKEAAAIRPVVPEFSIARTADEQYMIVERIKNATAMRQGFDLLYQHLTGRKPGE